MRFTNKLYAQHLGWTFKKHWQVQGKRVPRDTGAIAELEKLGIQIKDPNDVLKPQIENFERYEFDSLNSVIPEDRTHPNWHEKVCHVYGNSNLLLEGLSQAKVLTKTIEINGFPPNIEETLSKMQLSPSSNRRVQNSILASHVFDAEQVKLPKVKLPDRPAYNLPRDYGISLARKNRLLLNKLIFECEKLAGHSVVSRRKLIDNVDFKVTLSKDDDILQFDVNAEKMITSTKPIEPVKGKYNGELPDLHPIKCTISIPKKHIYTTKDFYAFGSSITSAHPHTIFVHFNKELVGNLHGTHASETQFQSRTMLKAFAVAASRAKQLYGESTTEQLPKPIVIQSIQTDGRVFHFGIFQLNTLSLNSQEGVNNYWFHQPNMDLFTECEYKSGRPILTGYNKDVFRLLNAFYNNS